MALVKVPEYNSCLGQRRRARDGVQMRLPIPAPQAMPSGRVSRWASIAASLRGAIREGRLAAGECLPSTRTLARDLKVHRNTVLVALDQVVAEGWIEARPRRGYVVIHRAPATTPSGAAF